MSEPQLISPYGGELVNIVVGREEAEDLWAEVSGLPSVQISERAMCDLEVMATGGFSPLDRFMSGDDFHSVVNEMRLADGTLFPIPVTLPVHEFPGLGLDKRIALRDSRKRRARRHGRGGGLRVGRR